MLVVRKHTTSSSTISVSWVSWRMLTLGEEHSSQVTTRAPPRVPYTCLAHTPRSRSSPRAPHLLCSVVCVAQQRCATTPCVRVCVIVDHQRNRSLTHSTCLVRLSRSTVMYAIMCTPDPDPLPLPGKIYPKPLQSDLTKNE